MTQEAKAKSIDISRSDALEGEASEDMVYAAIYDAVMDHRLPPGTKLTESTFGEYFNVSRTVIRKTLFKLAQKNIVELRHNRGAIVARPTIEETRDVFNARRVIEKAIVENLVQCVNKEQIKKLKEHIKQEQTAIKNHERRTIVRLSGEFHTLMASMQPNKVLEQYMNELVSRTTLIVALYESPGSPGCTNHDHQELVNYLEEKNAKKVVQSIVAHLTEIENNLNLEETESNIDLAEIFSPD